MNALQKLLEGYRDQSNSLLSALAQSTGGTLAPSGVQGQVTPGAVQGAQLGKPGLAAEPSQAGDPLTNLINGYQAWARLHGGAGEKYAGLAQSHRDVGGGIENRLSGRSAVQQVTAPGGAGLAQLARVNQSGNERQGRGFQTYDLGNGQVAHVYYDAKGRRQVVKFRRPPAA
jgi:hypothetical protein